MLKSKEAFSWLSVLNVSTGIIFIVLATVSMLDTALLTSVVIILFGVSLLVLGITRLLIGIYWAMQTPLGKKLRIITGSIVISIALVVIISAYFLNETILLILLASALILNGALRVTIGIINKQLPTWFRILLAIVGLTTIAFAIVTIIYAKYGYFTVIILLALIFIFSGFTRIMFISLENK